MTNIFKAYEFARLVHGKQRYGNKPYIYHLISVARIARQFGGSETDIICCFLHDTIEDTPVTEADIAENFGRSIANVIVLVSNMHSKEQTFRRIRTNKRAVFVKLCDRIANVQEGQKNDRYRKEYPLFKEILYKKGEFDSMWAILDKLLLVK